jgi:hypothetical protein
MPDLAYGCRLLTLELQQVLKEIFKEYIIKNQQQR